MPQTLRIASWNIAGAHRMRSLDRFDYTDADTHYFADALKAIDPDIICLQESHTNAASSSVSEIASLLGIPYAYNTVVSPSHIDSNFSLGNAILSKYTLSHVKDVVYPYPDFELTFKDGRPAAHHDKMVQLFKLNNIFIANTQMLPLTIFGETYSKGNGKQLAHDIEKVLLETLPSPIIFCGDFNYDTPSDIYPNLYRTLSLLEALPDKITRPNKEMVKKTPDHILISKELVCKRSNIIKVQADHYLCYADILLP